METIWIIVSIILALAILGQLVAATGDVYLSIADPRPIGGKTVVVTMLAWGFAARRDRSALIDDCDNQGMNDARFFMTFGQSFLCVLTLGFIRKVSVHYRCYAGDHPMGDA